MIPKSLHVSYISLTPYNLPLSKHTLPFFFFFNFILFLNFTKLY